MKVLIVDDEIQLLTVYGMILETVGATVVTHHLPEEAFKEDIVMFDLIVSDYKMMGMNGLEFLEEAHKRGATCLVLSSGEPHESIPHYVEFWDKLDTLNKLKEFISEKSRSTLVRDSQ